MESLGKELDLRGKKVNQGISVYGNKGSTDQHAYIQQLYRECPISSLHSLKFKEREGELFYVEHDSITTGDYLNGFLQGTRQALYENGRESITVSIKELNAFSIGVLIALYERAVGFYASLVNINAYHQPGVEAGKKAAQRVIDLELALFECLARRDGHPLSVEELSMEMQAYEEIESIYKICERLVVNGRLVKIDETTHFKARYAFPMIESDEFPLS